MIATAPADILRFLLTGAEQGLEGVLVTLTGIETTSSRGIGCQMAVAADGSYAGSFSGGCVEAAVVSEALDSLASGEAKLVRFGVDSPYLDIRLPCGGGVDLLFNPRPDLAAIAQVLQRIDVRQPSALRLSREGMSAIEPSGTSPHSDWHGQDFEVDYVPPLRIVALGQGEDLTAFARLAQGFGAGVTALSPDEGALQVLGDEGVETIELVGRTALPLFASDPWTATIFLFHDRDWEEGLLPQALSRPAFYYGAVGSRRTHQARLQLLRAAGVPEEVCGLLHGPVGLIPATRDPATLALSILAEVVRDYQRLISQRE